MSIPAWVKRYTFVRPEDYVRKPTPPHTPKRPGTQCSCTACDAWREYQVLPGSLVTGIRRDQGDQVILGASTWDPNGPLLWGDKLRDDALVVGFLPDGRFDTHVYPVLLWSPTLKFRVCSASWLVVLSGGRSEGTVNQVASLG